MKSSYSKEQFFELFNKYQQLTSEQQNKRMRIEEFLDRVGISLTNIEYCVFLHECEDYKGDDGTISLNMLMIALLNTIYKVEEI